jgi:D-alanine-D-alanine ligase
MRVTVLNGGPSAERAVSLVGGAAVIDALRSMGHEASGSDISPDDLSGLDRPADVIFPVLHGQFGESGELQEILEARGLCFVGSDSKASRLGMNKVATKQVWQAAGLPTPAYRVVRRGESVGAIPSSCVVKANDSGSSLDVFICKAPAELPAAAMGAIAQVLSRHPVALIEQFIDGVELTVGILEEQPLAPIRIVAKSGFFDYNAKYHAKDTEHRFDTGLPPALVERWRELARQANALVGARDLARVDMMVDAAGNPYLLEINTLPGFTPTSLLPEAARHAGIEFGPLVDRLVHRALARRPAARPASQQRVNPITSAAAQVR